MQVEEMARVCHEVNRGLCEALGDTSQTKWEDAPDWQRESAINGVNNFLGGQTDPSESHRSWMREKWSEGWTYGPEKDVDKKTHPCLLTFDMLPREQQLKDHLFTTVVRVLSGLDSENEAE